MARADGDGVPEGYIVRLTLAGNRCGDNAFSSPPVVSFFPPLSPCTSQTSTSELPKPLRSANSRLFCPAKTN